MTTISASLARGWLLLRDIHHGCRCERCIVTVPSAECPEGAGRARGVHEAEKYRLSGRVKLVQIRRGSGGSYWSCRILTCGLACCSVTWLRPAGIRRRRTWMSDARCEMKVKSKARWSICGPFSHLLTFFTPLASPSIHMNAEHSPNLYQRTFNAH